MEGIKVEDHDERPPPAIRTAGAGTAGSKKRAKADEDVLSCDVCRRDIGTGALRLVGAAEDENTDVTIEVLCAHCEKRYLRCSDCGGGGGMRGSVPALWTDIVLTLTVSFTELADGVRKRCSRKDVALVA